MEILEDSGERGLAPVLPALAQPVPGDACLDSTLRSQGGLRAIALTSARKGLLYLSKYSFATVLFTTHHAMATRTDR